MLDKKLFKKLKEGTLSRIPLKSGYYLSINEYRQVYLSRGGKKKYFLTDSFVSSFMCNQLDEDGLDAKTKLINVFCELEDITGSLRKDSKVRTRLENLLEEMTELL